MRQDSGDRPQATTERTPLILSGQSTIDASGEDASTAKHNGQPSGKIKNHSDGREVDKDHINVAANQSITLIRGSLTLVGLGSLILLQATNISLLTVAQSAVASDLDAFELTSWFTSAYLIAMSALGPLNGKLAAVFTPRIAIFASAWLLAMGVTISGLAHGFRDFIVGRIFAGMGAAGILTISIIIILELTSSKRRGLAVGLLNTGFTIGVAAGATVAGALLPHTGWRALFLLQAPIAILGGTCLLFSIPSSFTADGKASTTTILTRLCQLDYLGALTLTTSITLCLYSLGSSKHIPLMPLILSPIVFAAFVLNELYLARDPVIPIALLKSRGLLLTCLATMGYMMARWTVLFYTPTYAIAVRQWSPAIAGAVLIPTNGGFALGGLLVGWLHIRRQGSFYTPTLVVYAIFPVTLILLAVLATHSSNMALFVWDVLFCGAATGAALNYNLAHLLHLTPKSTHYIATSLLATFRGFSGSFGSAIGGGLFTRTLHDSLVRQFTARGIKNEDLIRRLLGSPALVGQLEGLQRDIAIKAYEEALRKLFLCGAGLAACMVLVQAGTGWKRGVESSTEVPDEEESVGVRENEVVE